VRAVRRTDAAAARARGQAAKVLHRDVPQAGGLWAALSAATVCAYEGRERRRGI
jgi:hypothetical protein